MIQDLPLLRYTHTFSSMAWQSWPVLPISIQCWVCRSLLSYQDVFTPVLCWFYYFILLETEAYAYRVHRNALLRVKME